MIYLIKFPLFRLVLFICLLTKTCFSGVEADLAKHLDEIGDLRFEDEFIFEKKDNSSQCKEMYVDGGVLKMKACPPEKQNIVFKPGRFTTYIVDNPEFSPENTQVKYFESSKKDDDLNYAFSAYKVKGRDLVRIVAWHRERKDYRVIREIAGTTVNFFEEQPFSANDKLCLIVKPDVLAGTGHYLCVFNFKDGTLWEYEGKSGLVRVRGSELYFLGEGNDIYTVDLMDKGMMAGKVVKCWLNTEGLEVENFGVSNLQSFVRVRGYGYSKYLFYADQFGCFLGEERNIEGYKYVIDERSEDFGVVAYVVKSSKDKPIEGFLRHIRKAKFTEVPFSVKKMKKLEVLDVKEKMKEMAEVFLKQDYVGMNSQSFKCELGQYLDSEDEKIIESEMKLKGYEGASLGSIEGMYSMTIQNRKDGYSIPINVYRPVGATKETPKPMIVYVHGGPRAHADLYQWIHYRYWASRGYWVVAPEVRGATGYGKEHTEALVNRYGKEHIEDVISVAEAFRSMPEVSDDDVFLMGESFGGYTTEFIATHPEYADHFSAMISLCGVSDFGKMINDGIRSGYYFNFYEKAWELQVGFPSHINYNTSVANREISPIYHVENAKMPLLLVHGTLDFTVFPDQSEDMHKVMRLADKEIYAIMVNGTGHNFGLYEGDPLAAASVFYDLPVKFFNEFIEWGHTSLSRDQIYYVDDMRRFMKDEYVPSNRVERGVK